MPKKRKTIKHRFGIYHKYNKRTGFYSFFKKNLYKLLMILAIIIVGVIVLNQTLLYFDIDIKLVIENVIEKSNSTAVLLLFFVSESILGWIPPDFFIIWAKAKPTDMPYLNITIIATISYLGGIVAYYLGTLIRRFPRINKYVETKYAEHFDLIKKWGGLIIVMAALFPLPFATISTIAGVVKYPLKPYLLYGSTRYLRFFLYAIPIFWGLSS